MAALVEVQIAQAVKALEERNTALCEEVIQNDKPVNDLEMEIDHQCIQLLATQQPIARDLRFIAAAMKINADVERMGDIAVNIARRTRRLIILPLLKPLIDIPRMALLAQSMVKRSLDAFVRGDEHLAREVCQQDDQIDHIQDQIFRELLTYMMEQPRSVPQALQLIFISRHIERIADHATNIAESVVYFLEGKSIKHRADDAVDAGENMPS